jgi:hypothetical protein
LVIQVRKEYRFFINLLSLLVFLMSSFIHSQDWTKPLIKNLHRVDLRNLGYPMVNEIPENSSAITSLLLGKDNKIYGGTTGEMAYLFLFDPITNKVKHLGKLRVKKVFITHLFRILMDISISALVKTCSGK